jgi:cytochrome c oxidase subunit II
MKKEIRVVEPEEYQKMVADQKPFIVNNPSLVADLPSDLKELAEITISEYK